MLRFVSFSTALVSVGILFACTPKTTSVDDTGPDAVEDDTGDSIEDGEVVHTSIYDIQSGAIDEYTDVMVKGAIVTAPTLSEGFFVQDAGGGEYSGIYVYMQSGLDDLYLSEGDEIDIIGYTVEYYEWTELTVTATANLQVTGEGDVVVDSVDPDSVSDWEVWESCLISLGAVEVSSVDSYGEALVNGGVELANLFFNFDTEVGATYTDVLGVVSYEYEEWKLNPRSEDDLVGYVGGPEAPSVTVYDIQSGDVSEGASVEIVDVVVTSPLEIDEDYGSGAFYVQDAGGGEYSGIYVYVYGGEDLLIEPGDTVTLSGSISEYYDLTEISLDADDLEITGTATVTTDSVNADTIGDWEVWEGCLIQIGSSEITKSNGYGDYYLDNGLLIDNVFMDFDDGLEGTIYSSITGPLYYSYSEWRLLPRSEDDLVQ